jgi:S1-C subfamily serine protease
MRSHRLHRLIGYLAILIVLFFTTKAPRAQRNNTDTEIVIVKAPLITRINPYQTEYEQMLYPTVRISSPSGTGSGVIIATTDAHRYTQIITAAHVVENQSVVDIELYDSTSITGTVVITDTDKDLALIRVIRVKDIYSARLAPESYQAYLFTPIYTVGCSLGLLPRPSNGIITAINIDSWEVSSPILPGNSGGPVYDARTYEVIGIAVWVKIYQGQLVTTMAGIVPINHIYEFLNTAVTAKATATAKPLINTNTHK